MSVQGKIAEGGQIAEQTAPGLSDAFLLLERPNDIGGVQRVYRFPCGAGLSLINATMARSYPYAWEAAVLSGVRDDGGGKIDYTTDLTDDVVVFGTDEEANAFLAKAAEYFAAREVQP